MDNPVVVSIRLQIIFLSFCWSVQDHPSQKENFYTILTLKQKRFTELSKATRFCSKNGMINHTHSFIILI